MALYQYPAQNTIGITQFPLLTSYLDATTPVTVSGEEHLIPLEDDAVVELAYIPQCNTDALNTFVDFMTLESVGFVVTVDAAARTLSSTNPPAAGAVFVGISLKPNSTRLAFNTADRGKTASISYKGLYANADCLIHNKEIAAIQRLEEGLDCAMISQLAYSDGYWDGTIPDDKTVTVLPAHAALIGSTGVTAFFPGLTLDFGAAGNAEVAAFTNASYWKRIVVSLDYISSWVVATVESAEASLEASLVTPTYPTSGIVLGYVDVQNDGTPAVAGAILAIEQATITNTLQINLPIAVAQTKITLTFEYDGTVLVGERFCRDFSIGQAGTIDKIVLCGEVAGSAGTTRLLITRYDSGGSNATNMITDNAKKPQLAGDSSVQVVDITPAADCAETSFTATQVFKVTFDLAATGAANFTMTWYLLLS